MSITSLSFTFVNMYAPQAAKPAAPAERQAPVQTEARHCGEQRPANRQNRLVEAMISALRELGVGSQASAAPAAQATTDASPTATSAQAAAAQGVTTNDETAAAAQVVASTAATDSAVAATEAKPAAEPAVTVESAVRQFAYELFSALRQVGRGESSEQGSRRIEGDGERRLHHGHRGHHGWRREGYGDMAQRLNALSQTFAAPAAVAAAGNAQANPAVSSSISITLTIQDGQAASAVEAVTTPTSVAASAVAEQAADAAESTSAPSVVRDSAKNPLLDAFSRLFSALKPQAAGAPPLDMADKLRSFLQTLAQAMRPETMSGIQTPQVGGLVNVTA